MGKWQLFVQIRRLALPWCTSNNAHQKKEFHCCVGEASGLVSGRPSRIFDLTLNEQAACTTLRLQLLRPPVKQVYRLLQRATA